MTNADGLAQYVDAAATAPLRPEAYAAMREVYEAGPGNPSSVHSPGHRARATVTTARDAIARAFGAHAGDVIFTSGGTEANNLAIIGLSLATPRGRHLVSTPIEHPSVLESLKFLERVHGYELTMLPVDPAGRVDPAALDAALRPTTTLVSIGLANAEIGTVQDLPALAARVRACGAIMHTDAVQAAASLPVSIAEGGWPGADVDALTVASHKFGGPQGAGALIVRHHVPIEPLLHGGGQERGARSGTENVAGIAGFAAAVRETTANIGSRALALAASRDALMTRMLERVPGAAVTGHETERLPGHASFVIAGVSGESVLVALDTAGFAVSSGSACAAGHDEPSPTLLALGIEETLAQTAIRFTLHAPLSENDLDRIVDTVARETAAFSGVRSP